jgi:hypothetical protein
MAVLLFALPAGIARAQSTVDLQGFVEYPYRDAGAFVPTLLPRTLDTLYSKLGKPLTVKEESAAVPDRPETKGDKRVFLTYGDMYIIYYYSSDRKLYIRLLWQISAPKVALKAGVAIGMNQKDLISVMGPPSYTSKYPTNTELIYLPGDWEGSLNFSLVNGRLNAINIHSGD